MVADDDFEGFTTNDPIFGSLATFNRLTHIELDAVLLFGIPPDDIPTNVVPNPLESLLPGSLVTARFDFHQSWSRQMFAGSTGIPDSLSRTEGLLPRLKTIHLTGLREEYLTKKQRAKSNPVSVEDWAKLVSAGHRIQLEIGSLAGMQRC